MSYMVFSQYTGDSSNFETDLELARKKFTALGASRLTGSVALTGEAAGSFTVASMWDTADGYFDARPQVVGDAEISALMQSRGMSPVQTSFTEVYGETGTPEGKYAISVITVVEVQTPEVLQSVVDSASNVMLANGVNGMRFTRAIAAGQQKRYPHRPCVCRLARRLPVCFCGSGHGQQFHLGDGQRTGADCHAPVQSHDLGVQMT